MKIERDEDVFDAIKEVGEDIHLESRNYNNELIAIEYYKKLSVLSLEQLITLESIWSEKTHTCLKEKLASRWMVIQVILIIVTVTYIAWFTAGDYAAIVAGVLGMIAIVRMLEDDRVRIASKKYKDATLVYEHLKKFRHTHYPE
jgi:hypothetical protein